MKETKSPNLSAVLSSILAVAVVVGCAPMEAYEGPKLAEGEVSVIDQASAGTIMSQKAIPAILCVDGKKATGQTVHVVPGRHQIVGYLSVPPVYGLPFGAKNYVCLLEFETQPGHEYHVNGGTQDAVLQMWVRDITTDEVVVRNEAITQKNVRDYDCGGSN